MDIEPMFEKLYQSIIQKNENPPKQCTKQPLQNVSKPERSSSSRVNKTFTRTKAAASPSVSEAIMISSQRSTMSTFTVERMGIVIRATKSGQPSTTPCPREEMSVKECLSGAQRSNPRSDISQCHMDCVSESSASQYTYEATDGYQSGESDVSDVQRLCQDCKNLYKKVRKMKQPDIITEPCATEPKFWYSKSWTFVNRFSAKRSRKTVKRGLQILLKRLKCNQISRSSPATRINWTCRRSHIFLKRNLRLFKEKQMRLLLENQGGKRKQPNSRRKSKRPKKCIQSNQEEETWEKKRKTYSFVLDSSQEEDADPERKRYKLETKMESTFYLQHKGTEISSGIDYGHSLCSGHVTALDQPERVKTNQPPVIKPGGHNASPSGVYSVQSGSFREQLQKWNMGYVKSAIVKES